MGSSSGVNKSAYDVLSVLKAFASLPDEASLSEITTSVGLSKVKVCRALKTLVHAGFAEQNEETRKYRLHYALLDLSSKLLSSRNMNVAGRKILEELSDAVKEDITGCGSRQKRRTDRFCRSHTGSFANQLLLRCRKASSPACRGGCQGDTRLLARS